MSEIRTLQDLKDLLDELMNVYGCPLKDVTLTLSDRFNEFQLTNEMDIREDSITINCRKIGSVFKGTHRVLGGE